MSINSAVRVWVRSLGDRCRVRVESMETAHWLLQCLTEKRVLAGLESVEIRRTKTGCLFEIPNSTQRTLATLEQALGEIPEVELMLSPEGS